jgi:hypothetical protein
MLYVCNMDKLLRLQGCSHPLHRSERERKRKKEGERERDREKRREKERESVRKRMKKRGKEKREYLFLKGMTGALAPFSYLVY